MYCSFVLDFGWWDNLARLVSFDSLWWSSNSSIFYGSHSDYSHVNSARHAVLLFDIQFGDLKD